MQLMSNSGSNLFHHPHQSFSIVNLFLKNWSLLFNEPYLLIIFIILLFYKEFYQYFIVSDPIFHLNNIFNYKNLLYFRIFGCWIICQTGICSTIIAKEFYWSSLLSILWIAYSELHSGFQWNDKCTTIIILSLDTLFFAFIQSVTAFPLLYLATGGTTEKFWHCIENRPKTLLQLYSQRIAWGSLLGSWLGAIVIPLDWDRWWQRFPFPCLFGLFIATLLGALTAKFRLLTNPPFSKAKASY